jgi:hypothetical protein
VANLAFALNFMAQDSSMPVLPEIAQPPLYPCTLDDILEYFDQTGAPVVNTSRAMAVAGEKRNRGEDNETYDFYLLLKSDHMQGWQVPEILKER